MYDEGCIFSTTLLFGYIIVNKQEQKKNAEKKLNYVKLTLLLFLLNTNTNL